MKIFRINALEQKNAKIKRDTIKKIVLAVITSVLPYSVQAKFSTEPQSDISKNIINQYEQHISQATTKEKESYYYLMAANAMGEKTDNELIELGKKISSDLNFNYKTFNSEKYADLLCSVKQQDCITSIVNAVKGDQYILNKKVADIDVIYHRYQWIIKHAPAVPVSVIKLMDRYPDYQVLFNGQRLTWIKRLQQANNGYEKKAIDDAYKEFDLLKNQLEKADTLLSKMVMANLLNHHLQYMTILKSDFAKNYHYKPLKFLTLKQRGMKLPIGHEYSVRGNKHPIEEFLKYATDAEIKDFAKMFGYKIKTANELSNLIDFNQYRNIEAKFFNNLIKKSHLTNLQFVKNPSITIDLSGFSANNPIGKQIYKRDSSLHNYLDYLIKVRNIDSQIQMTNYILNNQYSKLSNIYSPVIIGSKQTSNNICLSIPSSSSFYNQSECQWISW